MKKLFPILLTILLLFSGCAAKEELSQLRETVHYTAPSSESTGAETIQPIIEDSPNTPLAEESARETTEESILRATGTRLFCAWWNGEVLYLKDGLFAYHPETGTVRTLDPNATKFSFSNQQLIVSHDQEKWILESDGTRSPYPEESGASNSVSVAYSTDSESIYSTDFATFQLKEGTLYRYSKDGTLTDTYEKASCITFDQDQLVFRQNSKKILLVTADDVKEYAVDGLFLTTELYDHYLLMPGATSFDLLDLDSGQCVTHRP